MSKIPNDEFSNDIDGDKTSDTMYHLYHAHYKPVRCRMCGEVHWIKVGVEVKADWCCYLCEKGIPKT